MQTVRAKLSSSARACLYNPSLKSTRQNTNVRANADVYLDHVRIPIARPSSPSPAGGEGGGLRGLGREGGVCQEAIDVYVDICANVSLCRRYSLSTSLLASRHKSASCRWGGVVLSPFDRSHILGC